MSLSRHFTPIRIAIADNSDLVIQGARASIKADPRLQVVHTVRSYSDLTHAIVSRPVDVILLDEQLYNMDVLQAVQHLLKLISSVRIIVLGTQTNGLLIQELFVSGICAYLYRGDDLVQHLATAIEVIMRNRPYLSPTANAEYLVAMQSPSRHNLLNDEATSVLRLLAEGAHIGTIASELGISTRRVYWIRQKLRDRFAANTNEHMISRAIQEGFVFRD